jgi:hypothetical protein
MIEKERMERRAVSESLNIESILAEVTEDGAAIDRSSRWISTAFAWKRDGACLPFCTR